MRQPLQRGMTGLERKGEDEIATEWNGNETEVILCEEDRARLENRRVIQSPDNTTVYNYICIMPSNAPMHY